ncbi:hypothetical protein [Xanthomonas arboricola]|uniref:hypothetical protein n=1 Tax=Xanthomonas arboricola TaxID=56448 RepID=UPI0012D3A610|nr:hypothetical protein [Xanthomonas arboricola]
MSAHVRQGIVGGAIDYQDVFVDAFGNAVNGALMQRGQAALATRSQNTQAFSDEPTYLLASNGGGGGVGMALPEEFWPLASGSGDVRSNAINVAGTQESQAIPTMDTVYAVPDKYSPDGWYFYSWNPADQQWNDMQRAGRGGQVAGWSAPPAGLTDYISQSQQYLGRAEPIYGRQLAALENGLVPQMNQFDSMGRRLGEVSDSTIALQKQAEWNQFLAAQEASANNPSAAIASLTARGFGADQSNANAAAVRNAELTQSMWDLAGIQVAKQGVESPVPSRIPSSPTTASLPGQVKVGSGPFGNILRPEKAGLAKGTGASDAFDTIPAGQRLILRPIEIEFPASGLTESQQRLFSAHLSEQQMTLNRLSLTRTSDLELNLANYPNVQTQIAASRRLARGYLPGNGQGLDAAHALDSVAGGYVHEFAGFRSPIQQRIGSLWRTRTDQIARAELW